MTSRKRTGGQALPIKGRKSRSVSVPKNVVSTAGRQVTGLRRDLFRYVDFHPALITLTAFAIVALVCVIYLGQVTAVTNANYTLEQLQSDHTTLVRERENLQIELARSQSISNIEQIARGRLQMVPIGNNFQYLTVPSGPLQGYVPATATPALSAGQQPDSNSNP